MRVHIFDPQLNRADGHWSIYDAAIVTELKRRGIETHVYGSTRPGAVRVIAGAPAEPIFSRDMFDDVATDPHTWGLENLIDLGTEFAANLSSVAPDRFNEGDLAFFPNIIQYQIEAVRQWLMSLAPNRRPTVILKLSVLTHAMPYLQSRPQKEIIPLIYRFAILRLLRAHKRTRICSDTDEMVAEFTSISGMPISLLPIPLIIEAESQPERSSARICVACLGHSSMLKGTHLIPDVVRRVISAVDAPHFLIQSYGDPVLCSEVEQALSKLPKDDVTLIRSAVDIATYRELMNRADIILLPYTKDFYGWASSGIFAEAFSLGKVIVVTAQTWAARQLQKFDGGGVVFEGHDGESVAVATQTAVRYLSELRVRARGAAPLWKKQHCPASFVDKLLELAA